MMRSPKSPQKTLLRNHDQKEKWTLPIGRSNTTLNNTDEEGKERLNSPSSPTRPSLSSDRSSQTSFSIKRRSDQAANPSSSSGNNSAHASTNQQHYTNPMSSSSGRSSRRSDQGRPGTASTVGSYMSARPFMEEPNSPKRKPIPIPRFDHRPSSGQSSEFVYEDFLANNGETLLISPISELARQNSVTKRDILNSANSAYASSTSSHHDDDNRSATSSRRTVHALAEDGEMVEEGGVDGEVEKRKRNSKSSRNSNSRSQSRPRSGQAKVDNRTPSLHADGKSMEKNISTHGSTISSNGGASPILPVSSLPVHPHHRIHKSNLAEKENLPPSTSQHTPNVSDSSNSTEKQGDHQSSIQSVPAKKKKSPTPQAASLSTDYSKGKGGRSDKGEEIEKTPMPQTTPKFSNLATFDDSNNKSPLIPASPALSEKSGNAFRERMKKTGGFFRRLGGGGSGTTNNLGNTSNNEASTSKISLLQPRKQVLRKGSHSSLVSEGGGGQNTSLSNSRSMYKEAASTDDVTSWSKMKAVPVPSIPEQYRQTSITPSVSRLSQNTLRGSNENDAQSKTRLNSSPRTPQSGTVKANGSGDYSSALKAWEKEMDAALEKSGQNLEEKTKIEKPRSNWTPSPQLPEYKVLNRKGSFMDEGNDDQKDKQQRGKIEIGSDASKAFGISMSSYDSQAQTAKESLSYDSHFLRPGPFRYQARTSDSNLPDQTVSSPISPSPTISPSTEPIRSIPRFVHESNGNSSEKMDFFKHSNREDNVSTMTTKSYETAIERPSLFLKHAEEEETRKDFQDALSTPVPSNFITKDETPAITEPTIRLITTPEKNDKSNTLSRITEHSEGSRLSDDVEKAKELAEKCWNEDETFKKREKIAEWLGGHGVINKRARVFYFENLDFKGQSVDSALRKLCNKLLLRAETQQIDRILAAFSHRYSQCNPKTAFGSADVVHAVTFSIFLLNTDLHVAEMNERMTRHQFIRNTIDAILESGTSNEEGNGKKEDDTIGGKGWEAKMESILRDIYNSVKAERIKLPLPLRDETPSSQKTLRVTGTDRVNALKRGSIRGIQGLMGNNFGRISEDLPQTQASRPSMASDAHSRPSISSLAPPSSFNNTTTLAPTIGFASTLSKSIIRENGEENETSSIDSEMDDFTDEELALMGPPWAKEGMLTRKHYWEAPSKRAKDKNWLDCFTVIQKGQLSMFRFGSNGNSESSNGKQNTPAVGGGNWLSNATCIGQFSLAHSLANILPPPGYNRSRPHVFALSFPSGSVYFFQAAHEELVQEWAATCNYWAARLSKEPMAAGVSNMEYGWNRLLPSASPSNEHFLNGRNDDLRTISSARSITDTMSASVGENFTDETEQAEELTNSSATAESALHSPSVTATKNGGQADARSVRSGRSGRSMRLRTNGIFQGWSNGNSLDQIVIASSSRNNQNSNQSGFSSPLTSSTNLSSPGTSITMPDRPMMVYDWRAPMPPSMPSNLNEEDQLEACIRQTARIEEDLTIHNSLRQPMVNIFRSSGSVSPVGGGGGGGGGRNLNVKAGSTYSLSPSMTNFSGPSSISLGAIPTSPGGASAKSMPHPSTSPAALANKALANWERKSAYLLSELTKFQLYVESLKAANQLRSDKRSQRELNRMMKQADEGLRNVGNDVHG